MSGCAVANCKSYYGVTKGKGISYYTFPLDDKMQMVWIMKCRRRDYFNPKNARMCSLHFSADSYIRDLKAELLGLPPKKRLKLDAVPTLNLPHLNNAQRNKCELPVDSSNDATVDSSFLHKCIKKPKISKKTATKERDSESSAKTKKQKKKKPPRKVFNSTNYVQTGDDDGSALKRLPGLSIATDIAAEITSSDATQSDILPTSSGETSDGDIDPAVIRNEFSTFFDFIATKLHNINDPNMQQLAQIKIVNVLDEIEMQCKKQSSAFNTSDQAHMKEKESNIIEQGNTVNFEGGVSDFSETSLTNENGKRGYERDSNYGVLNSNQENLTSESKKQAMKCNDFPSPALSINKKSDYQNSLVCNSNINQSIVRNNIENGESCKYLLVNFPDSSFNSSPSILINNVEKQVNSESILSSITNSYQVISVDENQPHQQSLTLVANNFDQANLLNNVVMLGSSESLMDIVPNANSNQSILRNILENKDASE